MRAASEPLDTAELVRLITALRAAVDVADHAQWTDARTHAATVRLRGAAEAIATLFTTRVVLPPSDSQQLHTDLEQLLALPVVSDPLRAAVVENIESAALIGDRIAYTLTRASDLHRSTVDEAGFQKAQDTDSLVPETLASLSRDYSQDAVSERRITVFLYMLFAALIAVGLLIAWIGLDRAQEGPRFSFTEFSAYGLVAVGVAIVGVVAMWQASRHHRAAREAARLGRQLVGFEAYTASMPSRLGNLLRGSMAQQLFPPLPEDDEPWRRPEWPSADSLLEVLDDAPAAKEGS